MFLYTTMGMGIQSWEWEGMGSKKSFLHISKSRSIQIIALYTLITHSFFSEINTCLIYIRCMRCQPATGSLYKTMSM